VTPDRQPVAREILDKQTELAYQQARVLLLMDGLTKLAKLDFLVRYPGFAARVLPDVDQAVEVPRDPRASESPMVRYRYGPWDHRYYEILGALAGRGLITYRKGNKGTLAFATTQAGRNLSDTLTRTAEWRDIAATCAAVVHASRGLSGNALKELIYARLPEVVNLPKNAII
jgi:hypothetical protein